MQGKRVCVGKKALAFIQHSERVKSMEYKVLCEINTRQSRYFWLMAPYPKLINYSESFLTLLGIPNFCCTISSRSSCRCGSPIQVQLQFRSQKLHITKFKLRTFVNVFAIEINKPCTQVLLLWNTLSSVKTQLGSDDSGYVFCLKKMPQYFVNSADNAT